MQRLGNWMSWQRVSPEGDGAKVSEMKFNSKVRTCFWFDGNGHEAAEFYVSLLPDSYIENVVHPNPDEPPLVVEFTLAGAPMMVLNGGPQFSHSEAASISVLTNDQE